MPGLDSPIQLVILMLIALVVLGPKRLPEMGRSLGRGIREFKSSVSNDSLTGHGDEERVDTNTRELGATRRP